MYRALLPVTRQTLHQCIVQVLQARFTDLIATQPELIAQRASAAGLISQAVTYWQQAGQRALASVAEREAFQHFTTGLHLLGAMPDSPENAHHELGLQVGRGRVLIKTQGYAAPEVRQIFTRAFALCEQLGEAAPLLPVRLGIWSFHFVRADMSQAQEHAEQLVRIAESQHDAALLLEASMALGSTLLHTGVLGPARLHLQQCLALYDPTQHQRHALVYGQDPGMVALSLLPMLMWVLGYPQQAQTLRHTLLQRTEEIMHPFSRVLALGYAAIAATLWQDAPGCMSAAEACLALAHAQGFPGWSNATLCWRGWARASLGDVREGIWQMHQGAAAFWEMGARLGYAYYLALLAELYGKNGQPEAGLRELTHAFQWIESSGECWNEVELHRFQGVLLMQQGQQQPRQQRQATWQRAARHFQQACVVARRQQARGWELRAATSLAHLWLEQGQFTAAYDVLAPLYAWFSEGQETADLQEAQRILAELS